MSAVYSSSHQQCTVSVDWDIAEETILEHEFTKNKKIPDRNSLITQSLHLFILVCSELRKPQLQAKRESCV